MAYDNEKKGVLFKNNDKTEDTHPAYKGSAEIEGVQYWLSAWINKDKNGNNYMSLSFQAKENQQGQSNTDPF